MPVVNRIAALAPEMAGWRRALFAWLARNAMNTPDYFRLPPNRVVELGAQVPL